VYAPIAASNGMSVAGTTKARPRNRRSAMRDRSHQRVGPAAQSSAARLSGSSPHV
jgi:hypothetical protein